MSATEVWILYRAREFPRVGEFSSEADALDFAEEFGLVDWRAWKIKQTVELFDGQEHKQVCSTCGEDWPCRVERVERQARHLAVADRNRCAKCGKQTTWVRIVVPGGGLLGDDAVYCGKLGSCRTFALRELLRLGHDDLHSRAEEQRAARSRDLANRKAAKAQRRAVWRAGLDALSEGSATAPAERDAA